ncbi:unnamed protein product, partial [Mycena citricolor]
LNRVSQSHKIPAPSASMEMKLPARRSGLGSNVPQDIDLPGAVPLVAPSRASTRRGPRRVHKCQVCHKEFSRPNALRTHMNGHNKLRPFPCGYPHCHRTFSVRSNARRHFKTHKKGASLEVVEDAPVPSSKTQTTPVTSQAHSSSELTLTFPYSVNPSGPAQSTRETSLKFQD